MGKEQSSHWRCANRDCEFSRPVRFSEEEKSAPLCLCGTFMQKENISPVFSYLDFLRGGVIVMDGPENEKES
jgi:hypothetical protein